MKKVLFMVRRQYYNAIVAGTKTNEVRPRARILPVKKEREPPCDNGACFA